jgi:DNA polymerase III delta prime subunit
MILSKYNNLQGLDTSSNEYFKLRAWLEKVVSIPFGIYKDIPVRLEDGNQKCVEFMTRAKKCLDDAVYGQDESKLQIMQFISTKIVNPESRGLSLLLTGAPGIGKCHAKDTEILMADGSIKLVQDIVVGDKIMGDDSNPREVLSLGRGQDMMYDIIPTKGNPYRVNSEHIMCLKQSGKGIIQPINGKDTIKYKAGRINNKEHRISYKTFKTYDDAEDYLNNFSEEDNIVEISVKNFLALPSKIKNGWLKGYRKGVNFPYIEPDFDPYIIGLWLGDGSSSSPKITSQDAEIITYLQKTLPQYNLMLSYYSKYDYSIRAITNGKKDNIFLEVLKKYNMLNNKYIPSHFKCNSRDVRLKLLAGLVDTDGYVKYNTIEIVQKSKQMADDILYLARSLGFAAYSKEKNSCWTYKNIKKYGVYNKITISGDISEIPIRIKRKIPETRLQKKDVLVTGIEIKEAGYGDYYGFTLDGNHRYLMGDFTVTHNTSLIKNGIAKALDWPFQFISLGGDSDASTYTGHQLVYESSHCGKIVNSLIASKSMSTVLMFDEVDKISQTPKGEEIMNLLIHLTDPVQNGDFEDKYLAGVPIDLSKVMFIFSANDINKIDKILLDRMMVIDLKGYDIKQKTSIAEQYLLPLALKEVNLIEKVSISKDILTHIIQEYANEEKGVRELKRCIEQVTQKINMLRMFNSPELPFYIKDFSLPFIVKKEHIKLFIKKKENTNAPPFGMYL